MVVKDFDANNIMKDQFIVIYGDLMDGVQGAVGIFDDRETAEYFAESHNLGHYPRWVVLVDIVEEVSKEWIQAWREKSAD